MRPAPDEHAPAVAGYIAQVPDGDIVATLSAQGAAAATAWRRLAPEQARHRYAPGKWSVAELVGHVADAERIFAYRCLRIARGDATPLPGFDEDAYVAAAGAEARPFAEIVDEFAAVRAGTVALARGLTAAALLRRGSANGAAVSARALLWIAAGHAAHHRGVLAARYGVDG